MTDNLPTTSEKPTLREWLEQLLPFRLPQIPFVQTAKNLDLALARIIGASGANAAARIERSTTVVIAKSEAEKRALNAAGEIAAQQIRQGSPLAVRALDYAYRETILAQKNRESIGAKAAEALDRNPPHTDAAKEIDLDWLNQFASFAEKISSEDLQSLWAKLLAGEIRNPGSIRIRTLQQLSVISRDEAELVHTVLSYVIDDFIYRDGIKKDIGLRKLIACEHLDLLSGTEGALSMPVKLTAGNEARYKSHNKRIRIVPEKDASLKIPVYLLTTFAHDLLGITQDILAKDDYLKSFGQFVSTATGAKVFIADIVLQDPVKQAYSMVNEIEM